MSNKNSFSTIILLSSICIDNKDRLIGRVPDNQHNFLNVLKTDINMDFFGSPTILSSFLTSILK